MSIAEIKRILHVTQIILHMDHHDEIIKVVIHRIASNRKNYELNQIHYRGKIFFITKSENVNI